MILLVIKWQIIELLEIQRNSQKLKEKENRCFVCGSTENIGPHHIKQVKQTHKDYYNEDNIVLLCDYHHHKYHKQYPHVNLKTFCEFFRDNFVLKIKENEANKVNKKRRLNMDIDLNKPLKISKLTKFMKLVNKPAKKQLKFLLMINYMESEMLETKKTAQYWKLEDLKRDSSFLIMKMTILSYILIMVMS